MKVVSLLVIALLFAGATETLAQGFWVQYRSTGSLAPPSAKFQLRCSSGYTDGYDGEPRYGTPSAPFEPISMGVYKTYGEGGWNSDTGFYLWDLKSIPTLGQVLVFDDIYLWALPGTPSQDILLVPDLQMYWPRGWNYKLSLVSIPVGITYNGPREWGLDSPTILLPFYATDYGTTGYKFRAEVTAIPEPLHCSRL